MALRSVFRLVKGSPFQLQSRSMGFAVTYKSYGSPREVLKYKIKLNVCIALIWRVRREDVGGVAELGPNDVHVKVLAAPVNPSDLNMVITLFYYAFNVMLQVENVYGVKAKLPAVAGNEGVGVVQKVS